MTMPNTPDICARRLIQIFVDQGLKADHTLATDAFIAPFSKPGWTLADLEAGLDFAVDEDWIEQVSMEAYRLTAEGFAAV